MKLWQKVSLTALIFVMLAIQITQFVILERSFENAVAREKQTAIASHEALCASLSNHAAYQRLKAGKLLLSIQQVDDLLGSMITEDISAASAIMILRDRNMVSRAGTELFSVSDVETFFPAAQITSGTEGRMIITDLGNTPYLILASNVRIETVSYVLCTAYDVSDIYHTRTRDLHAARSTGLLCGAGISVVMILFVWAFLHPLKVSVRTIHEVAAGNYRLRVPVRGSEELRDLASSINHMSESIDEREQKLREIADSRKRFADSMAHEMKTPLTSILGFADILRIKRTVTDSERQEYAGLIVEEAKHLRGLSAKLLQLASTDGIQLDRVKIPAAELFEQIAQSMAPILSRYSVQLETAHENATLYADRELFLALFYNLIENAAKASSAGSVIRLEQTVHDGHTVLSVIDHGIGMKPDTVRRATEAFYMEDKARTRKAGGAGLGLALCDEICRRHDARLEIESVYGRGTTIRVHMPADAKSRKGDAQ